MARPDKAAAVAELSERFSQSAGIVLTDYRGLTVKALKDLRRSLGDDATYAVSKNTLTTIAAREAGVDGIEDYLVGPTAIAFIDGDPVVVAKGLRDFARTNPLLVIKGGVLDGKFMGPDEVRQLADLESREVCWPRWPAACRASCSRPSRWWPHRCPRRHACLAALEQAAADDPSLLAAAEETAEPTNEELAADAVSEEPAAEPTNEELAADAVSEEPAAEPTNEELAAEAVTEEPAAEAASAAPAAPPTAETAAEDTTPAPAAEDN